jgi:hypothetical protein
VVETAGTKAAKFAAEIRRGRLGWCQRPPAQDIARIAEVNHRPRKTLAWQRPADLFHTAIASA